VSRKRGAAGRLPDAVPANTVNRLCSSGLPRSQAHPQAIRSGGRCRRRGGVESMTRAPVGDGQARPPPGRGQARWPTRRSAAVCTNPAFEEHDRVVPAGTARNPQFTLSMGDTAEEVAASRGITRAQATRSRCAPPASRRRTEAGRIRTPSCQVPTAHGRCGVTRSPPRTARLSRWGSCAQSFAIRRIVTARVVIPPSDGAARAGAATRKAVRRHGLRPLARVAARPRGAGRRPHGLGPVPATEKLLGRLGLTIADPAALLNSTRPSRREHRRHAAAEAGR